MSESQPQAAFARMEAAHAALLEAERLNDPVARGARIHGAYREAAAAFADLFSDAALELSAAAFLNQYPWMPEGLNSELLEAARAGVDLPTEIDPEGAAGCRNALARLISDHGGLLPDGLAERAVRSLSLLNLGEVVPMFQPLRAKGTVPGRSNRASKQLAVYSWIYYRAGYNDTSIQQAIDTETDLLLVAGKNPITPQAIFQFAKRFECRSVFEDHRRAGREDALNNRPFFPPIGGAYSLRALLDGFKRV